jgi:hypothetical protein
MFCHNRIAFLRKDEILMPFINSYNYRVLIVVGWVCQSKVSSSIITNSVLDIHKHSIGLLIKAIKTVLGFLT